MQLKKLISALSAAAIMVSSFAVVIPVSADDTMAPITSTQSASFLSDGDGKVTQTVVNYAGKEDIQNINWNNASNSWGGTGVLEFSVPAVEAKRIKSAELTVSVHNGSSRSGGRTYDVYPADITINADTTSDAIKTIPLTGSLYQAAGVPQGQTRTDRISVEAVREYVKSKVNEETESTVQFAFSNSSQILDIDPKTATLTLTMYDGGVALDKTEITLSTAGEPQRLTYNIFGAGISENDLVWESADSSIASVDNTGLVTPHKAGKTVVSVKTADNSFKADCAVTVEQAAENIVLDKTTLSLLAGGKNSEITAKLTPDGVVHRKINWTSSNETVATVSTNGIVTPKTTGEAVITATAANNDTLTAQCSVTVSEMIQPESISLDKETVSLPKLGATISVNANIQPLNADDRITWTSSNTKIAQVYDGVIVAGEVGTAEITASTSNGKTAKCTVTVTEDKQLITNDRFYTDTDGNPLYSQGGGIFKFPNDDKYYWYGVRYEDSVSYAQDPSQSKNVEHPQMEAFTCYTSTDLVNWKYEGDVATAKTLGKGCYWGGRCGVVYDAKTKKYVLVSQYDGDMTASANSPLGPFKLDKHYFWGQTPGITNNQTGDLTVFYDEDGSGYVICSSANGRTNLYVVPIVQDANGKYDFDVKNMKELGSSTKSYYDEDGTIKNKDKGGIEGDCMFKYKGHYYFTGSDLYGWHGSRVYVFESESILGDYKLKPDYVDASKATTNYPYIMPGAKNSYAHNSQTGFYYTLHGSKQDTVIYCGDRWCSFSSHGIGYNQWVPITMDGYTPHFNDLSQWRLDAETGLWTIGDGNNYISNPEFGADRVAVNNLTGWECSDSIGGTANGNVKDKRTHGNYAARHSADVDYTAALKQNIKDLPDGTYTLRASVKSSGGQNECILYASAEDSRYTASLKSKMDAWTDVVIKDIVIKNGECEIGVYSDALAGNYMRINDLFLTRNYDGTVIDGKPNTNVPPEPVATPTPEPTAVPGMLAAVTDAWHNDEEGMNFYLNNAADYGTVSVYTGEFEDGKLINVSIEQNLPINSARQLIKYDYKRESETSTIKLFIWIDMLPAAESVTVTATENPYKVPDGYTSYFKFDGDLNDSKSDAKGTLAAEKISSGAAAPAEASYSDGYNGKAVEFTGSGSYGVNLGKVITDTKYTVAFRMKANAFTQHTSGIFINSGSTDPNEDWLSAPFGSKADGNTMIWSRKQPSGHLSLDSTGKMEADTWHHIAVAADGSNAAIYVDGVKTGSGNVYNVVTANTETYLGVNFWDTPFDGLIDDLYIYNGTTLTDEQITGLFEATNVYKEN